MEQTSLRKLAANRRNALESTGPRTPEGRTKVRWNALRHGLLAQEAVIPSGPGQEDDSELEHLLKALRDDLQPSGALEEILVEKIAVCYWRLRRVLRAENGEIRRNLEDAPRSLRFQLTAQAVLAAERNAALSSLQSNSYGLEALLDFLGHLEREIKENKSISNASLRKTARYFGDGPDGLAARLASTQRAELNTQTGGSPSALTTTAAERLLRLLDVEKTTLTESLHEARLNELERLQSDVDSLSLPRAAEKIVRYETAIERQLNRALYHLERLQERRKSGSTRKQKISEKITKQTQTSTSGAATAGLERRAYPAPLPAAAGCG